MSKALSDAVRWGLVGRNVASGALDLPQVAPVAARAWDAPQLAGFLSATATSDIGVLWRFVALTGCRRREALGLRWASVDLHPGTAPFVSQRVVACGGGGVIEGPPRTRSGARTVRLDAETVRQLRTWRKAQLARLVRLGVRPDHDLVFTGAGGRGLWPPRVTAEFGKAALGLGLPNIGVHGLRHLSATWLIGAGVSPKTVSQRLGHSTPAITLSLYAPVLPGHDQTAADAFAAALDGPASSRDQKVTTGAD
jgi:integrase